MTPVDHVWSPRDGVQVTEHDDTLRIDIERNDEINDPWNRHINFSRYDEDGRSLVNIRIMIQPENSSPVHAGASLGRPELLALRAFIERMLGTDHEREFNNLRDRLRREHGGGMIAGGDEM